MIVLAAVFVVAALVYLGDLASKTAIIETLDEGESVAVLGDLLRFHFVRNPGAAFSLASGSTWIFSIAAAGVTLVILWFARRLKSLLWAVLFGMLLGGTLGNLTDRLFREPGFGVGHVIDFIQVWGFPAIFNVADIFIVSSMGFFVLLTILGIGLDGSRTTRVTPESEHADETADEPAGEG